MRFLAESGGATWPREAYGPQVSNRGADIWRMREFDFRTIDSGFKFNVCTCVDLLCCIGTTPGNPPGHMDPDLSQFKMIGIPDGRLDGGMAQNLGG